MKVLAEVEIKTLPPKRLLAFHQTIGKAEIDGHTFEITRDLTGLHLAFHEDVDGLTVTHTVDINPVIEAALTAIVKGLVS
jgi:hypothetical protein